MGACHGHGASALQAIVDPSAARTENARCLGHGQQSAPDRSRTNLQTPSKHISWQPGHIPPKLRLWRAWQNQTENWNSGGPTLPLHSVFTWTKSSEREAEGWFKIHPWFKLTGASTVRWEVRFCHSLGKGDSHSTPGHHCWSFQCGNATTGHK